MAGRKIFVGSLPDGIDENTLRNEFGQYGHIEDVYVKAGCEPGRQWAFVTYSSAEEASSAKDACDRLLTLPGALRPCDVMVAKNQGMFGQDPVDRRGRGAPAEAPSAAPRKIFVGSLPDGIVEKPLVDEFSQYGTVEEIYLKQGCEPGRQWAFVTFRRPEEAENAANATDRQLTFPGSTRPVEVNLARNQGMFGQGSLGGGGTPGRAAQAMQPFSEPPVDPNAPRKIFVGSLPDDIHEADLRSAMSRYGQVTEIYIKAGCESGRQWAFVTYAHPREARLAKDQCDKILMFPGQSRPCEVNLARNQGLFGQDSLQQGHPQAMAPVVHSLTPAMPAYAEMPVPMPMAVEGPKKIFVGSLPDGISEMLLRAEFSKYGHVVDVHVKAGCEPGRQWAFVTFASADQALHAKEATDKVLTFPGASQSCEVMMAKNQGKFGQATNAPAAVGFDAAPAMARRAPVVAGRGASAPGGQPPPPTSAPPAHLTPWRMYKTVSGLPYYHNASTGVTQWECPRDLQAAGTSGRYQPY